MSNLRLTRRRVEAARHLLGWIWLAVLALPALADENPFEKMDQQVAAIVSRVTPAVVSVRVGPRRAGQAGTVPPQFQPPPEAAPLMMPARSRGQTVLTNGPGSTAAPPARAVGHQSFDYFGSSNPVYALLQPSRIGTGFVVDRGGMILTTADVVGNSKQVTVRFSDGRELDGKVLGSDALTGVALIKVESGDLPALRLAESDRPVPGQWAFVVGNQLDAPLSVWVGTVARTDAKLSEPLPQGKLLQIQAPVGAGASGAPVLNSRGDVMGVVVAAADPVIRLGAAGASQPGVAWTNLPLRVGKENPDLERQVGQLAHDAQRLGQRAATRARVIRERERKRAERRAREATGDDAERAKREADEERRLEQLNEALEARVERQTEKIGQVAERLGETIARRAEFLAEQQPDEAKGGSKEPRKSEAERRGRETELKRLEAELKQQQQSLHRELEKLNQALPAVPGLREIAVDLKPEIARVVGEAHSITDAAVAAALAAPGVQFWSGRSPGDRASTYAVPADRAHRAVADIRDHGRVAHAFLGVAVGNLKQEDRDRLKVPSEARVRVIDFAPDSPAREAGLQKEDLILEFQGKKLEDAADLAEQIAQARPGEPVALVVWRAGERRTIRATLRERPPRPMPQPGPSLFVAPNPFPTPLLQPGAGPRPGVPSDLFRVFPSGRVSARAKGTGRAAQVTLEAQDAELEAVLRELSRATQLSLTAEGEAARRRVTLKVEDVPLSDLIDSLERLYRLRSERQGEKYTFRGR